MASITTNPNLNTNQQNQTNTSTSKHDLPGAYPESPPATVAQSIVGTVQSYLPSQEQVQNVITSVGQTAKAYVPGVGANPNTETDTNTGTDKDQDGLSRSTSQVGMDSSHQSTGSNDASRDRQTTLPTTEAPTGSRVGVGSLPGTISDTGIAKLPEERNAQDTTDASTRLAQTMGTSTRSADRDRQTTLPTTEQPSGSHVGVGSLPGNMSETGVAKLPEERNTHSSSNAGSGILPTSLSAIIPPSAHHPIDTLAHISLENPKRDSVDNPNTHAFDGSHDTHRDRETTLPTTEQPSGSHVGVGSLPGTMSETSVAKLPEERAAEERNTHSSNAGSGILPTSSSAIISPSTHHPIDNLAHIREKNLNQKPKDSIDNFSTRAFDGSQDTSFNTSKGPNTGTGETHVDEERPGMERKDNTQHLQMPHTATPPPPPASVNYNLKDINPAQPKKEDTTDSTTADVGHGRSEAGAHKDEPKVAKVAPTGQLDVQHGHKQDQHDHKHEHDTDHHDDKSTNSKPSLMSKIKGEAKVIKGKIVKDEQKVQEGKRMMKEGA